LAKRKNKFYWWSNWSWLSIIILLFVATPIFTILIKLFSPPGESWGHLAEHLLGRYFLNTTLILLGVALITFILGVGTAWIVSNFNFPGRKYFEWLLILPLGFPGYIMAYTYTRILDYGGPLYSFINSIPGVSLQGRLIDIMNLPGAIFILSITLFPYVFLLSRTSFIQQSKSYQEASALLGKNRWATFFQVALPMARPAIVGGIALASMEVLNDYGTVKYFGVNTFTTGIFRAWFSMGDATTAIYLAAILLLFVLILLYTENWQRGSKRFAGEQSVKKPLLRVDSKPWLKWLFTVAFTSVFLISFGFPIMQIIYWVSITYKESMNADFLMLILRSFSLAAGAGLIIVLLSIVLLYAMRLSPFSWMKHIVKIATLGYAVPGAVIAVGIMIPLLGIDNWLMAKFPGSFGLLLSGTIFALVFAYVIRFMAVGYNPVEAGFQKIGRQVNEASRMLGAGTLKALLRIDVPLIKSSIISGVLLVFVDILKELPLTLILRPFNFHTLATRAFDMATNEMIAESANAALVIILTGIVPIIFLNRLIRKREF
jgi:iron(III) transport system permease protein